MYNLVEHSSYTGANVIIKSDKQTKTGDKVVGTIPDTPAFYPVVDLSKYGSSYYITLDLNGYRYTTKADSFLDKLKNKTLEIHNGCSNIEYIPISHGGKSELVELNGARYNEIIERKNRKFIPKSKILEGHVYKDWAGRDHHIMKNSDKIYVANKYISQYYNTTYFEVKATSNFVSESNTPYDNNLIVELDKQINKAYGYSNKDLLEFKCALKQ